MLWYNPKTRTEEEVPTAPTDEEAAAMLGGDPNSGAFLGEYERLRSSGMGVEQAMIAVGNTFRLKHLEHQSPG